MPGKLKKDFNRITNLVCKGFTIKKNQWALKQRTFILENSIMTHLSHKIHLYGPACEQNCKLKETGNWLQDCKQWELVTDKEFSCGQGGRPAFIQHVS
jgi:hypothetical protein